MRDGEPLVQPMPSPWLDTLLDALRHVQQSLLMVSPYIKEDAVLHIQQALLVRASEQQGERSVRIITCVNPDDLLSGASDIAALQLLLSLSAPSTTVEMRAISNLHAKVWICDRALAIVGSGNATLPGLASGGNLEYGLSVTEPLLIERILQDWQVWWELAQRVEASTLEDLARQLQTIKASDDMRQLQARNERLKGRLRAIPRIGTPIRLHRERQPASSVIKEPSAPISTGDTRPFGQAVTTIPAPQELSERHLSPEAISIAIPAFWQALRWVLPLDESAYGMISANVPANANLKLIWKLAPLGQQALHLIWADGKRYSQASLPAHNEALKQPWAVTLDMERIRMLGEMFKELKQENFFVKRAQQHFHLLLHGSASTLFIAYRYNRETNAAMTIPCTVASIPGSFPTLSTPLSCITVAHQDVRRALAELVQEWRDAGPLTVIELSLSQLTLTFTTGQIEAALTRAITATDS